VRERIAVLISSGEPPVVIRRRLACDTSTVRRVQVAMSVRWNAHHERYESTR
jgi:hypothetical protein